MRIRVCTGIDEVPAADWNDLDAEGNPFLRHEFLAALERNDCLGPRFGWLPHHLICEDEDGRLIGAAPLYLKYNSYGEFVFDWAWADAYARAGLAYYPKLVSTVPYTPVTGARLLTAAGRRAQVAPALADAALAEAQRLEVSGLHWLFTTTADEAPLAARGLLARTDCQFHWRNRGYRDFDDFLAVFRAERRKKVRRERRRVAEAGVEVRVVHGAEVSDAQWALFHRLYEDTFHRHGGPPTLSAAFFREIGRTLGDRVVLMLAAHGGRDIAAALCLRSDRVLYGRHWGCEEAFNALHFELCYYQGIDYAIRNGLERFEPGAQGEHKVWRGFEPTATHSMHWLAHPEFRRVIGRHLERERDGIAYYIHEMRTHSPYKDGY